MTKSLKKASFGFAQRSASWIFLVRRLSSFRSFPEAKGEGEGKPREKGEQREGLVQ